MTNAFDLSIGMRMPSSDWLKLNESMAFEDGRYMKHVSPFPPLELMHNVSGLDNQEHFAAHGVAIYRALQSASPKMLTDYRSILDFGCGCGRLARMFKGHPGQVTGCDLDQRHVDWINGNLHFMKAVQTKPNEVLPFDDGSFDAVVSISVFSHLNEPSQLFYLEELSRVSRSGAHLFLTTHGERAMRRALTEDQIYKMIEIPSEDLHNASVGMNDGRFNFVSQNGHLTSSEYAYGITFISPKYIQETWAKFFDVEGIVSGGIHDFQDIVVCRKR